MPAAVLAAWLALALGQSTWQAGLRGEARAFEDAAGDLLLTPDLALEHGGRSLMLQARYHPDLLLREPRARGTFNALQRGDALATWTVDRDTRLDLRGEIVAGDTDLSWLAAAPDAALASSTRPFRSELVDSFSAGPSLSVTHQVARGYFVTGTGQYSVTGGAGEEAQQSLPRTRTARVGATGAWIERRDAVSLGLGASRGWVSNGRLTTSWGGEASWRHAFSAESQRALSSEPVIHLGERPPPRYELELAAGASVVGGDADERHGVVPTASFTLRRDEPVRRPGAVAARFTLRYAPLIDPITGALAPRGEVSAALDVRLTRDLVALVRGGAGWTIDVTPSQPWLGQAAAGVGYELLPNVSLSAQVRVARLPEVEWAAVVATTLSQRGRF